MKNAVFSTNIYVSETMKYIVRILQFSIYKNANIFLNLIVADKGLKGTVVNQTCHWSLEITSTVPLWVLIKIWRSLNLILKSYAVGSRR